MGVGTVAQDTLSPVLSPALNAEHRIDGYRLRLFGGVNAFAMASGRGRGLARDRHLTCEDASA